MKYAITTLLLIAVLSLTAFAQQQTIFSSDVRVTGFGGPGVYYTQFNGKPHVLVGGSGAVLLNSTLYLGGAGYGLASEPDAGIAYIDGGNHDTHYEGGYAGIMLGSMIYTNDVVHAAADVTVGGGSLNRVRDNIQHDGDWNDDVKHDEFFAVQPMAHAELNVFPWMRVDAGAGYRFVSGVKGLGLTNSDVNGPVAGLSFRFGKF